MHSTVFNYTTIFAPVGFFLGGVLIVILLNKFIGKGSDAKKSDSKCACSEKLDDACCKTTSFTN
jgi:hypothetical protein